MFIGSLAVVVASFVALWGVSLARRDASIADIWWGPAQLAAALAAWAGAAATTARASLVLALVAAWAARLAWHIARRHRGEDPRYQAWRRRHGRRWWWQSLFQVFLLQAVIAWVVSWPATAAIGAAAPLGWRDAVAAAVALTALGFETVADVQLQRFRDDPTRRGRVLDTGLWRYSRHPNYFGDALFWWSLGVMGASATGALWPLARPALLTVLLLRVSGVTLLESSLRESRPGYADYVARTSAFVPWFPKDTPRQEPF